MNPFVVFSILLPSLLFALQFTQAPTFTSAGGGQWQIAFAVDQNTDVEVSIVNTSDSSVVRHLAAGLLGAAPPPPFAANSLSQTLTWDGKDDFGNTVSNPQALSARVRAGMYPILTKFAGEHLYDQGGNATSVTDGQGNVYILSNGSGQSPFLRKYDASGNYIKTLFPPPPHLPADSVASYRIIRLPDGKWVPVTRPIIGHGVQFSYLRMKGGLLVNLTAGKIRVNTPYSGTHYIDTSGCFTDTLPNNLQKAAVTSVATTAQRRLNTQVEYREGPFVMERIAVDRTNDRVFWNGENYITDWNNPVIRKLPMDLDNITVGPKGFLYGWNLDGQSNYAMAFIKRYNGTTFSPANYGNTGNNRTTGEIYFEFGWAGTPGNHRGIGVGWQGQVAGFPEQSPLFQVADTGGNASCSRGALTVSGAKSLVTVTNYTGIDQTGSAQTREAFMGVKYDPAGNYYVGLRKIASPIVPAGFGLDPAFRNIGSVVKFNKDSTGTFHSTVFTLTGHERIYRQPYGPFTMLHTGADILGDGVCTCRGSYFDVDPYGRVYVPNGVTCQIYIADNAGNNIAVFGEYGNTDCRGGLSGPGEVKSTPAFPFAWPTSVGASEDFVYVTDLVNARLVQVQMAYQLDNFPGLTAHGLGVTAPAVAGNYSPLQIVSAPNPFIAQSRVRVTLPAASRLELKVYDLGGRLVRTIVSADLPEGVREFTWNAKDAAGRTVSAGVYVYRLEACGKVVSTRTLLVK